MTHHSITTHDDTPLGWALARYNAGLVPWSEVQRAQAALMPRCKHGEASSTTIDGEPVCPACLADDGEALRARLRGER